MSPTALLRFGWFLPLAVLSVFGVEPTARTVETLGTEPTATTRPVETRFSQSLSAEERTQAGLHRLNSDQVAVIDALVRRDTGQRGGTKDAETPTQFSARLTADERRTAGLPALSGEELPKLDQFVDRYQSAKLARSLLAPPSYLSRHSRVNPTEAKPERKIRGSFMLSYGWGKGDYSEKTGAMQLHFDDPKGRYSISVGYSETHVKGGNGYYLDDPLLLRRPDLDAGLRHPSDPR